jgi:hypothetical protein
MKTLIVLAVFVVAMVVPASAQQAQRGGPYSVYSGDQYLGADPDPSIRFDLQRQQNWRNGGY